MPLLSFHRSPTSGQDDNAGPCISSPAEGASPRCLLLVSADVERDRKRVAAGDAPRRDYLELASYLNADIAGVHSSHDPFSSGINRFAFGRDISTLLPLTRPLSKYDVIFSDNERLGVLLAAILRLRPQRPRHVMLGHHLTPRKKWPMLRSLKSEIDTLIVHTESQRRVAIDCLGYDPDGVIVLPYQVDTRYWEPGPDDRREPLIATAGLEYRDYATLLPAIEGLGANLVIGAASNWSSKKNALAGRTMPAWVTVGSFTYVQLREVYRRSCFVAVPLIENTFQAGITLILEAMAAGRAVVVSGTEGQTEVVRGPLWNVGEDAWPQDVMPVESATGIYVRPGDVHGFKAAARFLLTHPEVCDHLGANGQMLAQQEYAVERYAERFGQIISATAADIKHPNTLVRAPSANKGEKLQVTPSEPAQEALVAGPSANTQTLHPKYRVLETLVHAVDCRATETDLQAFLADGQPRQVVTVNVDFLRQAHDSPEFADLINHADLVVADGRPVVWIARYLGLKTVGRVTGPDIMEMCARLSETRGWRLFLLGGEEAAVDATRKQLERRFPNSSVCGAYSPARAEYPFPAAIEAEITHRLHDARPDIVLVAFGCPKQEFWIHDHLKALGIPVLVGVGGSFNFAAGLIPRAPVPLQQLGLEWLYRLWQEPGRLWRRYLLDDLPFVIHLILLESAHRLGLVRRSILQVVDGEYSS